MWFVVEVAGIICATITYMVVLTVQVAFVRIGVWDELQAGDWKAYAHLAIFQYHLCMIFWSHIKCMTTEPGCLPRDYDELDLNLMSEELTDTIISIKSELRRETIKAQNEQEAKKYESASDDSQSITEDDSQDMNASGEQHLETSESTSASNTSTAADTIDLTSLTKKLDDEIRSVKKKEEAEEQEKKNQQRLESMSNMLTKFKVTSIADIGNSQDLEGSGSDALQNAQPVEMHADNIKFLDKVLSNKCKKCNSLKPPASHHCSICKRCIARMDHHCPWVNNCVGFNNQKFFMQFLVYVFLGSSHALVKLIIKGFYCLESNCIIFRNQFTPILQGVAGFMALLFMLFVLTMFCDQCSVVCQNTSTVDKLKKERKIGNAGADQKGSRASQRTGFQNIEEVFGCKFGLSWVFPLDKPTQLVFEREYD